MSIIATFMTTSSRPGTAPLSGVVVVALEQAAAAPFATCRLADAGARVIKVERPEGDFARGYDEAANGESSYFAWLNRGKESIALDLHDEDDRAVLDSLIDGADVVVQNFAVGAMDRLGFGSRDLRTRRPQLITCDISGYGPEGPYSEMKAYDFLLQAESGLLAVSGAPGPMGRVGVSLVDFVTGLNAALAITAAVVRQRATGEGAHIEVSLFDSIAEFMTVPLLHHDYLGAAPERVGLAHPSIAPYGAFPTADGGQVVVGVQSDREWRALCTDVLDAPGAADDERFATNRARVHNRAATDHLVTSVSLGLSTDDFFGRLRGARIACAHINDVAGLSAHPHLRRFATMVPNGEAHVPAPPARVDWSCPNRLPALDEHGASIRAELSRRSTPDTDSGDGHRSP